jgi:hypothetical protein
MMSEIYAGKDIFAKKAPESPMVSKAPESPAASKPSSSFQAAKPESTVKPPASPKVQVGTQRGGNPKCEACAKTGNIIVIILTLQFILLKQLVLQIEPGTKDASNVREFHCFLIIFR